MVDISKLLPPKSVLAMENSVCEPSLIVLIQEMVGRGTPLAVQLRESGDELRSTTGLVGSTMMEGGTASRIDYTIIQLDRILFLRHCLLIMHTHVKYYTTN